MKIKELVEYLNHRFLPVYQEDYDNAGFLLGDDGCELSGVLCSVDVTPAVVDEAVALHANLIVSHHPLIFGAVKRITPSSATGRLALRLLQQGIAVYAAHTNLDNLDWGSTLSWPKNWASPTDASSVPSLGCCANWSPTCRPTMPTMSVRRSSRRAPAP